MIEIINNLFVGTELDYEQEVRTLPGWRVVHACKEPYHRQALGYSGRAASKDHPEYLIARRGNRLILNLVDAHSPDFFTPEVFIEALSFIEEGLSQGTKTLVHCNQGESRGPSIGLLYLAAKTNRLNKDSLASAEVEYLTLYPRYNPKAGIRGFLQLHWNEFTSQRAT